MCKKCGASTKNVTGYVTSLKQIRTMEVCSKCGYRKVIE